jgi:hypothetical protein
VTVWSTSSARAIHDSGALGGIIISVPVSESMEHHNSASSNATTKVFKKSTYKILPSSRSIGINLYQLSVEDAELLCAIISDSAILQLPCLKRSFKYNNRLCSST